MASKVDMPPVGVRAEPARPYCIPGGEVRELAARLHTLADELDRLPVGGLTPRGRVLDDRTLVDLAKVIYRLRRRRSRHFADKLFGEPSWDMLLDLFIKRVHGERISITSLCIAGAVPPSTALRWIQILVDDGLVERTKTQDDQRLAMVQLTNTGVDAMRECLSEWFDQV